MGTFQLHVQSAAWVLGSAVPALELHTRALKHNACSYFCYLLLLHLLEAASAHTTGTSAYFSGSGTHGSSQRWGAHGAHHYSQNFCSKPSSERKHRAQDQGCRDALGGA